MKKLISYALAAVILSGVISAAAACGEKQTPGSTTTTQGSGTAAATTTGNNAIPDIPADANFNGYQFNIWSKSSAFGNWENHDIFVEEQNGDPLNDAVYARNSAVEEKLNIKIAETKVGQDYLTKFNNLIQSGDANLDTAIMPAFNAATSATQGYLVNYYDIPYVDLTKDYWDHRAADYLTVKGKFYLGISDITYLDKDSTFNILFNKKMIKDYNLETPYTLVNSGQWTVDKLIQMSKVVSEDLNGDGIYDETDKYGFASGNDIIMSLINASGISVADTNSDGLVQLSIYSDKTIKVVDKIYELMCTSKTAMNYHRFSKDGGGAPMANAFQQDRAMIINGTMKSVGDLRSMETDFGILPFPKYDESQKEYYNQVNAYIFAFTVVPITNQNLERTGIVLEALAAESRKTVNPAYYDVQLIGKGIRDNESEGMLDIIFSSRTYDLGYIYSFGNFTTLMLKMLQTETNTFTSLYAANESVMLEQVKKLNDAMSK